MRCPFCSYENIDGVDECARCRADLTDMTPWAPSTQIERDLLERPLGELATQHYVEVPPERSVRDTIRDWNEGRFNCAVIVSEAKIQGIFTERDLLYKLADRFEELADAPVRNYMTAAPETLRREDPIAFGLNRMMVGGYRHIPIEGDGLLVGMVSVRDILGYLVARFPDVLAANASS